MSSITVFLPTLGRSGLKATVRSFIEQQLEPDDRLIILGSGWEAPWIHLMDHPNIQFIKCPVSTCKGHENIQNIIHTITTDYWFYIGDDDVFMPGAFERIRPHLDGEHIIVVQFFASDGGKIFHWAHSGHSEHHIQFCQVFFPTNMKLPSLAEYKDVQFMDEIWDDEKIIMVHEVVVMPKFHYSQEWAWPWEWQPNES